MPKTESEIKLILNASDQKITQIVNEKRLKPALSEIIFDDAGFDPTNTKHDVYYSAANGSNYKLQPNITKNSDGDKLFNVKLANSNDILIVSSNSMLINVVTSEEEINRLTESLTREPEGLKLTPSYSQDESLYNPSKPTTTYYNSPNGSFFKVKTVNRKPDIDSNVYSCILEGVTESILIYGNKLFNVLKESTNSPQGNSPQGYSPQGNSPQGYSPQGNSPQGYSPQGYSPRGYSPQGYSPQGYLPQSSTTGQLSGSDFLDGISGIITEFANSRDTHQMLTGTPGAYNFKKDDIKNAVLNKDMNAIKNLLRESGNVSMDLYEKYNSDNDKNSQYILKTQIVPPVFPKCSTCCGSSGPCGACGSNCSPGPGTSGPGTPGSGSGTVSIYTPGNFRKNAFDAAGSTYNTALNTTTGVVNNTVGTAGRILVPGISSIGNTINSTVNTGASTLNSGLNTVTGTVNSGVNTVGSTVGSGIKTVGNTAKSLGNNAGNLLQSAGSGTQSTLGSIGSSVGDLARSIGSNVKSLIVSGSAGIRNGINNINISSKPPSIQGPNSVTTTGVMPQIKNNTPYNYPNTVTSSGVMTQMSSNSPASLQIKNNTSYNSPAQLLLNNQPKRMVTESTYPLSSYYKNIVDFPLPQNNYSPFTPGINSSTPSPISTISPASSNCNSQADLKLLMTPGVFSKNLNDAWSSSYNTPSSDYLPLRPDLGDFEKFN